MAQFIHSTIRNNTTVTAATTDSFDLPVGPLSHIAVTLRFLVLNANTLPTLANILGAITAVRVLWRGQGIFVMNGTDLFAYNALVRKWYPHIENRVNTINGVSAITFIVPLGRRLFDPMECFPRVNRGELTMEIQWAASFTNIGTLTTFVETIELPEANPKQFVKSTVQTLTPAATGQVDADLPIGNLLLGALIFSTTVPDTTVRTTSANQVRLLASNVEINYALANWDTLNGLNMLRQIPGIAHSSHIHMENTAAMYTQNADTAGAENDTPDFQNHSVLDLDPNMDLMYALETAGLADLKLRFDAGDTNAIRIIPIELVRVRGQQLLPRAT